MPTDEEVARASMLGRLRAEEFTGRPQVIVRPDQWFLDPLSVRQVAWAEGYTEVPPPHPAVLSFQCIRPVPNRWTHPPDHLYDVPADRARPAAEKRLVAMIQNHHRFWLSLRDLKLPRENVLRVAEAYGVKLAWELGDDTDQLLLLAKATIADPVAHPPRRGPLRLSLGPLLVGAALVFGAVCVAGAGMQYDENPFVSKVLFSLALGGVLAIPASPRVLSRSARAGLMTRDFDGRPVRTVWPAWFGFTPKLLSQAGEIYGYRFGKEDNFGRFGTTISFYRHPGLPTREARKRR